MTTRFIPDSASPGDTVICEISLSGGNKRELFRNAEPRFNLNLEFDKSMLQMVRGYGFDISRDTKNRVATFQIPGIRWNGVSDVVERLPFIVMASDTLRTSARVTDVSWGAWFIYNFSLSRNNEPFTVRTCLAGGPRLFRFGKATTFSLEKIYPNPSSISFGVQYSLTASEHIEIALCTSDGRLVRTLVRGVHSAGIYDVSTETSSLATGVYFLRLSSESGIQQMPLNIVH
jgi:hypothetical protein